MVISSIFDRIVVAEVGFSQLLYNFLQLSEGFRRDFFDFYGMQSGLSDSARSADISTQRTIPLGVGKTGRPDILIANSKICFLLEVKVALGCRLTEPQSIASEDEVPFESYLHYLDSQVSKATKLCFLVSRYWQHYSDLIAKAEQWNSRGKSTRVEVRTWDELYAKLVESAKLSEDLIVSELIKLISNKFGLHRLGEGDTSSMAEASACIRTIRKIDSLRIGITQHLKKNLKGFTLEESWDIEEMGLAILGKQSKEVLVWFGSYTPLWEDRDQPLALMVLEKNAKSLADPDQVLETDAFPHPDGKFVVRAVRPNALEDSLIQEKLRRLIEQTARRIDSD